VIPASYFPIERIYTVTVTAADPYVMYSQSFNITVEFGVDFSFTVSPSEPTINDGSN